MAERNPPVPDPADVDTDAVEAPQEEEPARKGLPLLVLLLPMILLPAGAGAYLAYARFPLVAQAAAAVGLNLADADDEEQEKPIEYGEFTEMQGLIVNPSGTDGTRYLMINLGLESPSTAALEEINARDIVVRDAVIKLLSQRSVEELADIGVRNEIKEELRLAINRILRKGEVERLYFTQYVLQ